MCKVFGLTQMSKDFQWTQCVECARFLDWLKCPGIFSWLKVWNVLGFWTDSMCVLLAGIKCLTFGLTKMCADVGLNQMLGFWIGSMCKALELSMQMALGLTQCVWVFGWLTVCGFWIKSMSMAFGLTQTPWLLAQYSGTKLTERETYDQEHWAYQDMDCSCRTVLLREWFCEAVLTKSNHNCFHYKMNRLNCLVKKSMAKGTSVYL